MKTLFNPFSLSILVMSLTAILVAGIMLNLSRLSDDEAAAVEQFRVLVHQHHHLHQELLDKIEIALTECLEKQQ